MKKRLIIYFICLFFLLFSATSWAESDTVRLVGDEESIGFQESPEFWTNTAYALAGSAAANTSLILLLASLDLGLETLNPDAQKLQNQVGILIFLPILSGIATAELMHLSPQSLPDTFHGSVIGSTIASLLSLGLIVTFALIFPQKDLENTYWTLLPSAFISTVLLQALGASWGQQIDHKLHLQAHHQGIQLVYQWQF